MRIRTRNDLIKFIEDNIPTSGLLRALLHYNENLGGFSKLPVGQSSGWIVKVVTPLTRRENYIVVQPLRTKLGYKIWILLAPVPWEYYDGDSSKNELYQGDQPEIYRRIKELAKAKKRRPDVTQQDTSVVEEPDRSDTR